MISLLKSILYILGAGINKIDYTGSKLAMLAVRKGIIKRPSWCRESDVTNILGCWSLLFIPEKINRIYCKTCDSYMEERNWTEYKYKKRFNEFYNRFCLKKEK